MDEIENQLAEAKRYRRMMTATDDKRAKEALETLAKECEEKANSMRAASGRKAAATE